MVGGFSVSSKDLKKTLQILNTVRHSVIKTAFNSASKKTESVARKQIGLVTKLKLRNPFGIPYAKYLKNGVVVNKYPSRNNLSGPLTEVVVIFTTRQYNLSRYVNNQGSLARHRKAANKHLKIHSKKTKKYATPLKFEIYKGKNTSLKRVFVGTGKGSAGSRLLVFRRKQGHSRKLSKRSPTGLSLSQFFRSRKNRRDGVKVLRESGKAYQKEFDRYINFKLKTVK